MSIFAIVLLPGSYFWRYTLKKNVKYEKGRNELRRGHKCSKD